VSDRVRHAIAAESARALARRNSGEIAVKPTFLFDRPTRLERFCRPPHA
jgi:hypothetical protein